MAPGAALLQIASRRCVMEALRHHLGHHWLHMTGCGVGALISVAGAALSLPIVAIGGAVICGGFCLDMARMMVVRPKRG
jgi:hypothetical protein